MARAEAAGPAAAATPRQPADHQRLPRRVPPPAGLCRAGAEETTHLDAPLVGAFLAHLERERGNSVRTRNARLAAIHSLFRYAAFRHPGHPALVERVLAIPPKRFERNLITFLSEPEVGALLAAPDRSSWTGRRDYALLLLATESGLRVSELIGLTCADVHLGTGAHISCQGKGRKQRITPLTAGTVAILWVWLAERAGGPADPLFPTRTGTSSAAPERPLPSDLPLLD